MTPYLMDDCGECRFWRDRPGEPLPHARLHQLLHRRRLRRALVCPAAPDPRPRRGLRRGAAALQVAFATSWHMLFTPGKPARRRDRAHQLRRQRHRLRRRAAREARRGLRDRQRLEPDEKLEQARGARPGRRASTTRQQDVVDEVMEPTDGRGVDARLRARRRRALPEGARLAARTGGWSSAAATPARSSPSTSSRSSAARRASSARSSTTATRSRRCFELAPAGRSRRSSHRPSRSTRRGGDGAMESREHFGKIVLTP